MRGLIVAGPDDLRARLRAVTIPQLLSTARGFRPGAPADAAAATKLALRSIARRVGHLDDEIAALDVELECLVRQAAPQLLR